MAAGYTGTIEIEQLGEVTIINVVSHLVWFNHIPFMTSVYQTGSVSRFKSLSLVV